MKEILKGIYRHFKGHYYTVLGVAKHSETLHEYVVYQNEDGEMLIKAMDMFSEHVENGEYKGPRFLHL